MAEVDLSNGAIILGLVLGTLMIVSTAYVYVVERKLERPGIIVAVLGVLALVSTVWQSSSLDSAKLNAEVSKVATMEQAQKSEKSQQQNASKLSAVQQDYAQLANSLKALQDRAVALEKTVTDLNDRHVELDKFAQSVQAESKKNYKSVQRSMKKSIASKVKDSAKKTTYIIEQQSQVFAKKIVGLEESLEQAEKKISQLEVQNEALISAQQAASQPATNAVAGDPPAMN